MKPTPGQTLNRLAALLLAACLAPNIPAGAADATLAKPTVADTVVKLESVGLRTDAQEISGRTGYNLTRGEVRRQNAEGRRSGCTHKRCKIRELRGARVTELLPGRYCGGQRSRP